MPQRTHLPPIERDTFTYAGIRIAVRLAAYQWKRKSPSASEHHPTFVLNLAERHRMLFPSLYGPLIFVAKQLAQGWSLREIRFMTVNPAPRTLHKRRPS